MRGFLRWSTVVALTSSLAFAGGRHPTRTPPAPPPVVVPQLVPTDVSDMARMLSRLHVRVMSAPSGTPAFDELGPGRQVWFVLPVCRTPTRDDPPGTCAIDRLRVEPEGRGEVHAGVMRTVTVDGAPQRVQVFTVSPETRLLRIRLITTEDQVRYQAVVETSSLGDLPAAPTNATAEGFSLEPSAP